jgi:LysM repeat protein
MRLFWLIGILLFLGGCLIRTYTIEKPRTDLDIKGNQGYLLGTPKEEAQKEKRLGDTRKFTIIEIEFGAHQPQELLEEKKEEASLEEIALEEEIKKEEVKEEVEVVEPEEISSSPEISYNYYTVQKDDTLQKISYKFYGTTKKWKLLYEENKDILKSPDKIYPGMKLKIPILK